MTADQFLKKLKETPRTWHLDRSGHIRNEALDCPLWAVAGIRDTEAAIRHLSLRDTLGKALWSAADAQPRHSQRLRRKLLEACGIQV